MTEDAYRQFEEWLQKQPYWMQDAAWYLYNKQLIDDKKIDEYQWIKDYTKKIEAK